MKLVSFEIHSQHPTDGTTDVKTFTFRKDSLEVTHDLPIKKGQARNYTWKAKFFMIDGSKRESQSAASRAPDAINIEMLRPREGKTMLFERRRTT